MLAQSCYCLRVEEMPNPEIQRRLQQAVDQSGKSKNQIVREAKIARSHLTRALHGQVGIGRAKGVDLARVLGVPSTWLLGLDPARGEAAPAVEPKRSPFLREALACLTALEKDDLETARALVRIAGESSRSKKVATTVRALAALVGHRAPKGAEREASVDRPSAKSKA